ncbi:hypothetical protein KPL70_025394 [Citrus sinensis]|nr:hypothetical protein KPL70_025394 [Citrus sinensis]
MANDRDRTIQDYTVLTPQAIHPGIVKPDVQAENFELKPVMFQMLQTVGQFNSLPSEDPHLHLKLFLEVSDAFKIAGASQQALRLRLFPFSLRDQARAWLNSLPPDSITTWNDLADKFLMKYFPPTKNAKLRNEITSFHQLKDESLYDTCERFKELLRRCPHHGIPYCIQLETFYNGLKPSTRLMVDASVNGALLSKSYNEAYEILERIANNNYQWPSTRQAAAMTTASATVNQISDVSCVYCGKGHLFDNCPRNPTSVNYVGSFNRQNQDNPYSNTYNPEWRQHPNFSRSYQNQTAAASSGQNRLAQPAGFYQQNQEKISINNDQLSSLEGLIKDYIVKNETVVQSHAAYLRNLENQIGQLATAEADSSVGIPNRRIESNQGQEDTQVEKKSQSSTFQNANKHNSATTSAESYDLAPGGEEATTPTTTEPSRAKEKQSAQPAAAQQFRHPLLFPQRFQKQKQDKQFSKILGVLKQLHINIPFVEALEQMPNYTNFFKDILTKKRRLGEFEIVALTQECNRMLQMFKQLGVGECRPTTVTLQLADRSHVYPEGKIEDVLVNVDKFIFLVDFIVLDFEADKEVPIILGRPFLATGKTLINVQKGELTMRVNDQQVTFNVLDAMKSPDEIEDCNFISVVDFIVAERLYSCCSKEEINVVTFEELDDENHEAANISWSWEKQPFRIDEQIQQRGLTPDQQEFKVNGPRVKYYMRDDMNNLKNDRFLKDPG